jgi:predicted 2-oxoglutarate/Fe(II)-dependent dioxygenase YbiX
MKHDWFYIKELYNKEQCQDIYNTALDSITDLPDLPAKNKKAKSFVCNRKSFGNKLDRFFDSVIWTNRTTFGLDIYDDLPNTININEYADSDNEYGCHRDATNHGDMSDIKLTGILNLTTEPYTGGEFCIRQHEDINIPELDTPGTILIFPSIFYHRVKPVLSGKRISLSCWFFGPNFK